jgi:hypothetical protein
LRTNFDPLSARLEPKRFDFGYDVYRFNADAIRDACGLWKMVINNLYKKENDSKDHIIETVSAGFFPQPLDNLYVITSTGGMISRAME